MEKIYNKRYFDKRKWLLENIQNLHISLAEGMLLLIIDYFNEYDLDLSLSILSDKCNVSIEEVDELINSLRTKGYLDIKVIDKKVKFTMDGLFDDHDHQKYDTSSIYELFESELGKILTQSDLRRINEWLEKYDSEQIISALREAVIYKKNNLNYIHNVLINQANNGNKDD